MPEPEATKPATATTDLDHQSGTLPQPADTVPQRTAVVVLGMHRSGTSAMAGMLGALGCALPQRLMPPTEDNPKGYFESLGAYQLNDAILHSAGSDWSDWAPVNPGWARSPVAPDFRRRIREVIAEDFGDAPLFVLKDPRLCRILQVWQQAMAEGGIRPLYVLPHRHPLEVAASLQRRDGWRSSYAMLSWLRNVLDAEAATRDAPRLFTSYTRLLSDWREVAARLEEALGLPLPRRSAASEAEVDDFLSADLRRNVVPTDAGQTDRLPVWVARALTVLERFAKSGEDAEGLAELDAINADFTATGTLFAAASQTADAIAQTASARDAARSRLSQTEAALDKARSVEAALRDLAEAERERHAKAEQAAGAALAEAQQAAERQADALTDAQRAMTERDTRIASLEAEVRAARATAAEARRAGIEEAEAVRAAFEQSRAWRITAPLRFASRRLRGALAR